MSANGNEPDYAGWLDALRDAVDEDELFAVIGRMEPPPRGVAAQQLRGRMITVLKDRFKELQSGASATRVADEWLASAVTGDGTGELQGRTFLTENVEPWQEPVDGADLLQETYDLFGSYVHTSRHNLVAWSLFAPYTYLFDEFGVSPLLAITSPTRRCGKTSAEVVLLRLCHKALPASNITGLSLFRAVEAWQPTLVIDEGDAFLKLSEDLRGIVDAGHTKEMAFVVRTEGDNHEPRLFSTWCPKIIAAIGRLPDTIEDRAIKTALARKSESITKKDAFDPEAVREDCGPVERKIVRFTQDTVAQIAAIEVERPPGLHDRAWNNWKPLLAIAKVAGTEWLEAAVAAAKALSETADQDEEGDVGLLTLQAVWEIIKERERMRTADVLEYLAAQDEGPWAKWWEGKLANEQLRGPGASLAKLLRPFGIKPHQVWIADRNERGYEKADFEKDTVLPYLEKDARDARDARPGSSSQAGSSIPSVSSMSSGDAGEHASRLSTASPADGPDDLLAAKRATTADPDDGLNWS